MANINYRDTKQLSKGFISRLYQEKNNDKVKDLLVNIHLRTKNDGYQNLGYSEYLIKSTPSEEKHKFDYFIVKQLELNNKLTAQLEDLMNTLEEQTSAKKEDVFKVLAMD